jgi:hypothetical protein
MRNNNIVERGGYRCQYSACVLWISKSTNTHLGCAILILLPQQRYLQKQATMLRYTCTACHVLSVRLHSS